MTGSSVTFFSSDRKLPIRNFGPQNLDDPDPYLCWILARGRSFIHGWERGGMGILGARRLQV